MSVCLASEGESSSVETQVLSPKYNLVFGKEGFNYLDHRFLQKASFLFEVKINVLLSYLIYIYRCPGLLKLCPQGSRISGWPRESAERPFHALVTGKEPEVGTSQSHLGRQKPG